MKRLFLIATGLLMLVFHSNAQVGITKLLTENLVNPIGIDIKQPRFSWQLKGDQRGISQSAYEIILSKENKNLWNSGKVKSDQSVQVLYSGPALVSGTKYKWKVRVWDNNGKATPWSEEAEFLTGYFSVDDWKAKWIVPGYVEDSVLRPSPLFRREFKISKQIKSATLSITSHGMYVANINGKRVGDAYLTPGWTDYNYRLQYQVYDITRLLQGGENAIGVMLGSGWYRGILGFEFSINNYGKDIALLCQLDISYSDGSKESIISDPSWKSSTGEVRYAEIYNGETIDARLEKPGWTKSGFDDSGWSNVKQADFPMSVLLATRNEPVKKHESFTPVNIFTTPEGDQVMDFGQNIVGWVRVKVNGKAGDKVTLSHAEVLDKDGNFYTENLRSAKAQNSYILKGGEDEIFEPHFSWQGFRYVKVEGYPGSLRPENFTAFALYSDMSKTGSFTCSNDLINQLQHNIQWGQKGNFLDIPTDCPQRDERLGWTGDAQVFSRTAAFNMNVNNFFAKWLQDLSVDQVNGAVPFVIPNILGKGAVNSCGWADVSTIIPWNMYLIYGDKGILSDQYPSMKAYVKSIQDAARNNLWNTGFHFGDWLFFKPAGDNDGRSAVTDKYLIAQCFYANSVQLLINAAKVLGYSSDVDSYEVLLSKIKEAFLKEYVTPNGRLVSGTQTAYVLALNFGMFPEDLRAQAAARLVENIHSYGNHLTTGFLGTPYLCHVLTQYGYNDLAYDLLLQESYPSWLYPIKNGATTIWERWDGIKPDGSFQDPEMNSFNHYAYGAIGDWMYRVIAGIDTYEDGPGYKHSKIQPHPGGGLKSASAAIETYYGKLSCSWNLDGEKINISIEIPANTHATVYLPASEKSVLFEGGKEILIPVYENGFRVLDMQSGKYHFSY